MSLNNIERLGVSVVLCCYNSKHRIVPTLAHLAHQQEISFTWEVVLIDNNSADNTAEVARETWTNSNGPCDLKIIKEPNAGTMYARRRGIAEAGYRFLLFCDDDNWLHPTYVKTAFELISRDSAIAAIGGLGMLEAAPGFSVPPWADRFRKSFGAGPQGKQDGDTTYGKGCLYTAGAILDRAWLDKLYSMGFESSLTGRDGKSLVAGEDTELTFALKLIGGKLHYSSQLYFKHFMPPGRLTWEYLKKMWQSFGYSDFLISPYKIYFLKGKTYPFIIVLVQQLMVTVKFFFLAATSFFAKGNRYVLKFHRSVGQLKACFFNYKTFLQNKRMVDKLMTQHQK